LRQDARNVGTQLTTHRTQGTQKIRRLRQDATPTDQTQDPFLLMTEDRSEVTIFRMPTVATEQAQERVQYQRARPPGHLLHR